MPTGHENHYISLAEAATMTARFRESITPGNKIAGYFGGDAIREILDQDGCVGMRYYYGLNSDEKPVLILVGVTADNDDLYQGKLAEMSLPCPDYCATDNPLNKE
ncbi:MAG: hypothetical protein IPP71_10515 [Bacteroidetes bacterium]|nr:hypothetical protein [Bacteroidota bacterium]